MGSGEADPMLVENFRQHPRWLEMTPALSSDPTFRQETGNPDPTISCRKASRSGVTNHLVGIVYKGVAVCAPRREPHEPIAEKGPLQVKGVSQK